MIYLLHSALHRVMSLKQGLSVCEDLNSSVFNHSHFKDGWIIEFNVAVAKSKCLFDMRANTAMN